MLKTITRDELVDMVCEGASMRIIDVLDRAHYEEEHIKGAISMPMPEIGKRARELDRDDRIVVYCASFECPASTKVAEELMRMGFTNVLVYKGGIKEYKEAGLPLEGRLHAGETAEFPCRECATC